MADRYNSMINNPEEIDNFAHTLMKLSQRLKEDVHKLNTSKKNVGETFKDRHFEVASPLIDDKSKRVAALSDEVHQYSKHLSNLANIALRYLNAPDLRD